MHIGFVSIESPEHEQAGGIAAYLRAVIPSFLGAGHRVTVMAKATAGVACGASNSGYKVVPVSLPDVHWYLRRLLALDPTTVLPVREWEWACGFYRIVTRVHRHDAFDVIEAGDIGAALLARYPPAPLIIRSHGSEYFFQRHTRQEITPALRLTHRMQLSTMRRARLVTAPSRFHADLVARELGPGVPSPMVIPNPVSPYLLARSGEMLSQGSNGIPTVVYVGRAAPVKGTVCLIHAFREAVLPSMSARLLLAGPWQLARSPASLGVVDRRVADGPGIYWLGPVPQHALPALYARGDVFVMPSFYETYSLATLEAMLFGLPVVASAAGALIDLVDDGVTGVHIPPGSSAALGSALLSLLRDPGLRRQFGTAGRRKANAIARTSAGLASVRTAENVVIRSWMA